MDAKVIWKNRLSFDGTADTGFSILLGSDPANGGNNDGFRPMELLLIGLAGCTAMDVISIMHKKKQDVKAFEVKIHADRANEHPRVFTHFTIEYIVTGLQLDPAALQRSIELSASKYCPAQAMFSKIVPIEIKSTIIEAK